MLGDIDYALAGGAENMSRSPYSSQSMCWGQKRGDMSMTDMLVGALNDPFGVGPMDVTAENVADEHGITRADQDAFALESQRRAFAAIDAGHFKSQILPVEVKVYRDTLAFDTDEHPKAGTTLETLAKLRPAFLQGWQPRVTHQG